MSLASDTGIDYQSLGLGPKMSRGEEIGAGLYDAFKTLSFIQNKPTISESRKFIRDKGLDPQSWLDIDRIFSFKIGGRKCVEYFADEIMIYDPLIPFYEYISLAALELSDPDQPIGYDHPLDFVLRLGMSHLSDKNQRESLLNPQLISLINIVYSIQEYVVPRRPSKYYDEFDYLADDVD